MQSSSAGTPARSPLPSLGDMLFVGILAIILWATPNLLFADGSTGWHLATGHFILDNKVVPHTDLISYTFPNKQWVPYEWLWDVFAAALESIGGLNLLATTSAAMIAGLFAWMYIDLRKQGLHFVAASTLVLIGAIASSIHWLARPHLVTFIGLYIYCKFMAEFCNDATTPTADGAPKPMSDPKARKLWIILGSTMLLWCNAHPAFLMGFAVIVIYLVTQIGFYLISSSEKRAHYQTRVIQIGIALAVAFICSLCNPSGFGLYTYIGHYLHNNPILEVTDEFNSPVFHGALYALALEVLFFLLALSLATSSKRPQAGQLLTVLAFAHLALSAKRNDPLFAIVAIPLIGELLVTSSILSTIATSDAPILAPLKNIWNSAGASADEVEAQCTMRLLPVGTVIALSLWCVVQAHAAGVPQLLDFGFDPKSKPTKTLAFLQEQKLDPLRGFNLDNWGGYIRYKTGNRVFIDDRSDFYGPEFFNNNYGVIAEVRSGWDKALYDSNIQWVLFPRNSKLVAALQEREAGGQGKFVKAAEDPASILFVRRPADTK